MLENLLARADARVVTELVLVLMVVVFGIAISQGRKGRHGTFLEHAPAVLVSLGIFGTFVGIVIGLLDFDAKNIQGSIEQLLGGLKTAFITSLAGMALSILLKWIDAWWFEPARAKADVPDDVTPAHIYGAMTKQVSLLEAMGQALTGNEEGSVAGQLKLLRADVGDFRNGLNKRQEAFEGALFNRLESFAEMLAKSATETVIEALRQVIADFNKHLVEQFGDNFKALDESVKKLVDWQASYKTHVETLEQRFETVVVSLERTAEATEKVSVSLNNTDGSIASIDKHCVSIPLAIGELQVLMEVNQNQIANLSQHLQTFTAMRDEATRAVPELQKHMERLAQHLDEEIRKLMTTMHEGALEFGKSADRTNSALAEVSNVVSTQSEQIGKDLRDAAEGFNRSSSDTLDAMVKGSDQFTKKMSDSIDQAARAMSEEFRRVVGQVQESVSGAVDGSMKTLRSSVESTLSDTQRQVTETGNRTLGAVEAQVKEATQQANEALRAQLGAIDRAVERELQKVFTEMGSALATISRRIADDHAEFVRERAQ